MNFFEQLTYSNKKNQVQFGRQDCIALGTRKSVQLLSNTLDFTICIQTASFCLLMLEFELLSSI